MSDERIENRRRIRLIRRLAAGMNVHNMAGKVAELAAVVGEVQKSVTAVEPSRDRLEKSGRTRA